MSSILARFSTMESINYQSNLSYDEDQAETYIDTSTTGMHFMTRVSERTQTSSTSRNESMMRILKDLENVMWASTTHCLTYRLITLVSTSTNLEDEQEHPSDMIQLDYDYFWKRHKDNINIHQHAQRHRNTKVRQQPRMDSVFWPWWKGLIQMCTEFHKKTSNTPN